MMVFITLFLHFYSTRKTDISPFSIDAYYHLLTIQCVDIQKQRSAGTVPCFLFASTITPAIVVIDRNKT